MFYFKLDKQFGTPYFSVINYSFPEAKKTSLNWVTRQSLTVRGCGN